MSEQMTEKTIYTKMRDGREAEYEVVREDAGGVLIMRNIDNPHNAEFRSSREKLAQGGYVLKSGPMTAVVKAEATVPEIVMPVIAATETNAPATPAAAVENITETVVVEPVKAEPVVATQSTVVQEAPKKRTRAGSSSKNRMTCEYFIIRFMPSAEREERVNVGIAVTSDDRYDVRFSGMSKAEALAPGYDLKAWKRDQAAWHQALSGTFSVYDEADYEAKVDALLTKYVL